MKYTYTIILLMAFVIPSYSFADENDESLYDHAVETIKEAIQQNNMTDGDSYQEQIMDELENGDKDKDN